jgi:catechol 2,3-dioxygenase-like lactoylglutathione lyase family enzyme
VQAFQRIECPDDVENPSTRRPRSSCQFVLGRTPLSELSGSVAIMDFRLELVNVPVSDVDRAKAFYVDKAGFTLDQDHTVGGGVRFVQLTPPGSPASISIGSGLSSMTPGSIEGLQLVVDDIEAARAELAGRGVEVSDVQVYDWGSFVFFSDPDGNRWAVQQLPDRT